MSVKTRYFSERVAGVIGEEETHLLRSRSRFCLCMAWCGVSLYPAQLCFKNRERSGQEPVRSQTTQRKRSFLF